MRHSFYTVLQNSRRVQKNRIHGGIRMRRTLIALLALTFSFTGIINANAESSSQPKEWTFLIYLNGNNNLDSFGAMNLNQMEKIGSTAKINVVVQWASLQNGKTQRLYMTKDSNLDKVTSPVIEDMGQVDMGDYHSVIDFVKWGAQKYPAKHYFVDIWDHGSGWHLKPGETMKDISWDEVTGNHITTKQLATALSESSKILGQKIDIYGSEVKDAVSIYAGSEETEPGDGWPYDAFLAGWNKLPSTATARDIAAVLTQEYANYYKGKSSNVTLSAFDLSFIDPLNQSIKNFTSSFRNLSGKELSKVKKAALESTHFADDDYVDLGDFLDHVKSLKISSISKTTISEIGDQAKKFVVASNNVGFPKAQGASIWIPTDSSTYSQYADRYSQMNFDHDTNWGDVAKLIANATK